MVLRIAIPVSLLCRFPGRGVLLANHRHTEIVASVIHVQNEVLIEFYNVTFLTIPEIVRYLYMKFEAACDIFVR